MHYYSHNINDFNNATIHLSVEEECMYHRALAWYYSNETPLPNDKAKIYRYLRATTKKLQTAVDNILDDFFTQESDGFHQSRCDAEIQEYKDKQAKAIEAGKASAEARRKSSMKQSDVEQSNNDILTDVQQVDEHKSNDRSTTVQPTNNHKPITNNHKPVTNTNKAKAAGVDSVTAMEWFDEFYALYPVKKSKGDALKAWQKIFLGDSKTKPVENPQAHFEKIMTGLKLNLEHITAQLNRGYGKHPSTWLNGMGWDDVHEAPEPQNQSRFGTAADPMAVDVVWNQPLRTEPAMSFDEMMAEMNANTHSPVDFLGN